MTEKKYLQSSMELWCERCNKFVFLSSKRTGPDSTLNEVMTVVHILEGNYSDALLHNEIGSIKRQISEKDNQQRCPQCGNINLKRKQWKGYLTSNQSHLEIYDSNTTSGKNIKAGFDAALKYQDKNLNELTQILQIIEESTTKNEFDIPEKAFKHKIYKKGFIEGLQSLIEYKSPPKKNQNPEINYRSDSKQSTRVFQA
jgi:hypothetical protein